jgi:hypothetical protein
MERKGPAAAIMCSSSSTRKSWCARTSIVRLQLRRRFVEDSGNLFEPSRRVYIITLCVLCHIASVNSRWACGLECRHPGVITAASICAFVVHRPIHLIHKTVIWIVADTEGALRRIM